MFSCTGTVTFAVTAGSVRLTCTVVVPFSAGVSVAFTGAVVTLPEAVPFPGIAGCVSLTGRIPPASPGRVLLVGAPGSVPFAVTP